MDETVHERPSMYDSFQEDGYVVLKDLIPPEIVLKWQAFVKEHNVVGWLFRQLHERGHTEFPSESRPSTNGSPSSSREYALGHGVKHGFCEVVMRSPGRYEISLLNLQTNGASLETPSLENVYKALEQQKIPSLVSKSSWKDVRISNVSLVVSCPGAETQGWHADGGHVNLQQHLPCHCFNVFCALEDVSLELGPTELRPGTQVHTRNLGPMMLAAKCRKTLRAPVTPLLKAGDALVFDYRILHRGLANTTKDRNRYMLVITVSQPWFQDMLNFPKRSMFASSEDEEEPLTTNDVTEASENSN
eukprot:CAMPEP_0172450244 /NCGR_PEP_ID=MMETSP1065-20121228/8669_1 /TAXON_ID=265537 /ORGANISM="Amphiprora paludosa, Strain CCMP125" /LENGTH=302 /DNA_ID=CAMNT_0013202023 /DNA_START=150 /DNA_END=1058 /DNA_ORIENTATION=-